jgi:PAS domain S-box-containing protein
VQQRTAELGAEVEKRNTSENALRESEEKYRNLVENVNEIVWEVDDQGRLVYVSNGIKRMLGYEPSEVIGTTIDVILTPRDRHRIRDDTRELLMKHQPYTMMDAHIFHKDGHELIIESSGTPVFDADGRFRGYRGVIHDITARKQIEEALRFYKFAIDRVQVPAFWMTEDGRFFYVNEAACSDLGYTIDELLQLSVYDIHPAPPGFDFADVWNELRKKGSITFETVHKAKNGRVYPVEICANLVVFDGKEYDCAFATDITERKLAEESLKKAKAEAEFYLDLMGHDINNMNQSAMGFLELALDTLETDRKIGLDEKILIEKPIRSLRSARR